MLPAINAVPGASKRAELKVELEMNEGGMLSLDYNGPISEAQLVREFLQPQIAAAKDKNTSGLVLELRFNAGLELGGDAPERLCEQLTRVGNAAVFVSAEAERA